MKENKEVILDMANGHILNFITPAGVDFDNTHCNVGENVGKIYAVGKYPTEGVDYGWLADLCNLEGTSTTIEYRPTEASKMTEVFNKKISDLKADRDIVKQESERQRIDQAIKDLEQMIHRISVANEPVGYINIMLHIQDNHKNSLNNRIKRVSSICAVAGCNIRNLKYKQFHLLRKCFFALYLGLLQLYSFHFRYIF